MDIWTDQDKDRIMADLKRLDFATAQRLLHDAVRRQFPQATTEDMIVLLATSMGAWLAAAAGAGDEKGAREILSRIGPMAELLFESTLKKIRASEKA